MRPSPPLSLSVLLLAGALTGPSLLSAQHAKPGELITAKYGAGGTWNLYMVSEKSAKWVEAQKLAAEKADPAGNTGKKGHLVTISSGAENQFVYHYIRGSTTWIGLTDDEKYAPGASEAGSSPEKGWAWVTGEPFTWMNWQSAQPTDDCEFPGSKGEDGVAIEGNGFWNDRSIGSDDQPGSAFPFMIEWDTQSKDPVPGARAIGAVLPDKWPALTEPAADDKSPWVCVSTASSGSDPRLTEATKSMIDSWDSLERFRMEDIYFQTAMTQPAYIFGWIFGKPREFPGKTTSYFTMLARARLVIPKAGIYTFNVRADDAFALRFPGHRWKRAWGNGGVDPVNPETLYTLLMSSDADTRGAIELPAGEVPVEVIYVNGGAEGRLQILSAAGEHPRDGSTSEWRLLGHKAVSTKVAWPGVTSDGWTVSVSPSRAAGFVTKKDEVMPMLLRVDQPGKTTVAGLEMVHFHDPECSRPTRFPDPAPYPGDRAEAQDNCAVLAEATLEVLADGAYNIGICGDDLCAIQLDGQTWTRIVRDSSGKFARMDGDSILCRRCDNNTSHEIIGEVKLTKGRHPIRAVCWDRNGASVMQIYGAPAGWPARLLKKGGAVEEPDMAGLEVRPYKP